MLALDLATATGWALLDAQGAVTSGVQAFPMRRGESPGMRWLRFGAWVREIVRLGGLAAGDVIAYEQPLSAHRGGAAAQVAHGLATKVQEVAADLGLELSCVGPAALKKHATGRGNAKKPQMIDAARARWPGQAIEDDNQADALLVLAWALEDVGEVAA